MKKALIIIGLVVVPLAIYLGIILYVMHLQNNIDKPIHQAIQDIKNPDFTIDIFDDNTPLQPIKTAAQTEAEQGLQNVYSEPIYAATPIQIAVGIAPPTVDDLYNSGYFEQPDYQLD